MILKKSYIKPKIKAIELDNKQAILQVCKTGGQYWGAGSKCWYLIPSVYVTPCPTAIKGTRKSAGPGTSRETLSQPS